MASEAKVIVERIRSFMHDQVKDLDPQTYKHVLEDLGADVDVGLEALAAAEPDLD